MGHGRGERCRSPTADEYDLAVAHEIPLAVGHEAMWRRHVVVSLLDTTFIDSAAIAALVKADDMLRQRDLRLVLVVGADSPAMRVLNICGLDDHFLHAETVPDAIEIARQQRLIPAYSIEYEPRPGRP